MKLTEASAVPEIFIEKREHCQHVVKWAATAPPHLDGSPGNPTSGWIFQRPAKMAHEPLSAGISIENTQFRDQEIWLPDVRNARAFQSDISNRRSNIEACASNLIVQLVTICFVERLSSALYRRNGEYVINHRSGRG
jgi:hypothetical protein